MRGFLFKEGSEVVGEASLHSSNRGYNLHLFALEGPALLRVGLIYLRSF